MVANRPRIEHARYELLAPSTSSYRITYDLSLVTPGATSYLDTIPVGTQVSDVSVLDFMSGAPLSFKEADGRLNITLARPVPKGGQSRIRILKTPGDGRSRQLRFERSSNSRRVAVVLPKNFELIRTDRPVQVIQEADGRIAASFMSDYPVSGTPTFMANIRARALKTPPVSVQHGDTPSEPRPPLAPADAPPPAQAMDQIRVTERAIQDREIVYFLKQPETHAFSLYHDYTASREGEHQYVNVVRAGSTVSDTSAMILDTGETLKTRTLTGADIAREKIEISERVEPDTEVVLIPFTPAGSGASIRLPHLVETYTDPARVMRHQRTADVASQLQPQRHGPRYPTTSSIPAVVSEEPTPDPPRSGTGDLITWMYS